MKGALIKEYAEEDTLEENLFFFLKFYRGRIVKG